MSSSNRTEILHIVNTVGRYLSAEDAVMSSFPGRRVPVYKFMKLLETQFSHGALYNMESSLTSFDDGLPQPDPYPPSYHMDMSSPTMMGRPRNPSHAHKETLHPKYHFEDAYSDGESQDAHHPQPRSKAGIRSKDKERKPKMVSQYIASFCVSLCILYVRTYVCMYVPTHASLGTDVQGKVSAGRLCTPGGIFSA